MSKGDRNVSAEIPCLLDRRPLRSPAHSQGPHAFPSCPLQDPRTVFVRNVAYDVDDEQLNSFFSELGPIKQGFLVKKGGGRHQGFGFVQFALEEDAERAVEELQGRELGGRKLKV